MYNEDHDYSVLRQHLKEHVIKIKFFKVDGSERTMRCTLKPEYLPQTEYTGESKLYRTDVINVWSIDDNAWRSFRPATMIEAEIE